MLTSFTNQLIADPPALGASAALLVSEPGAVATGSIDSRDSHDPVATAPGSDTAISSSSLSAISLRSLETDTDNSSDRPGASPNQNGIEGGWPCASSTRTSPAP